MPERGTIRPPAVAGMFYPDNPSVLSSQIDELLNRTKTHQLVGELRGLISPHAGYVYSGYTAANGYKLLEGKSYDTVVIVGPSHREYFDGISVYSGSGYRTPLGDVEIDGELREALIRDRGVIVASNFGHREEHAVEVQIPFLQKLLGNFKILPIVMGDQKREYCQLLADKLANTLNVKNKKILLVASTDLSHYYHYDVACKLDKIIIDDVQRFDYNQLMEDLETERAEACGGGPTVAMLAAAKKLGATKTEILHYCNSGDVTGDKEGVVGYLSAAVLS